VAGVAERVDDGVGERRRRLGAVTGERREQPVEAGGDRLRPALDEAVRVEDERVAGLQPAPGFRSGPDGIARHGQRRRATAPQQARRVAGAHERRRRVPPQAWRSRPSPRAGRRPSPNSARSLRIRRDER
jgi:hypothetical protein